MQPLITALLALIPIGASFRGVYCLIKMVTDSEQAALYRRRLINLVLFTIVAEGISALLWLVFYKYFYV